MIHRMKNHHHKAILTMIIAVMLVTMLKWPDFYRSMILEADFSHLLMILYFLPGFFILMGLFEVWVPKEAVVKRLGKASGVKGAVLSFMLGTVMLGPLYLAFPLAAAMRKKGARLLNVALFIGAWSTFKFVEEIFELSFLGFRFLLLRLIVSVPFVIAIALIIEKTKFLDSIAS
ncbi:hypothetical protein JW968_02735 [Candidatus Woesearchaeota archaeon]|nr:hypothetical protein [Candidatus Woesearchaeota archaeon]